MPDPLNFRDSKGYSWLLEALGLDGSESAVPISAEDRPYREKNKLKDEIRLSDLLSVEIKWSVQEEKATTGSKGESDRLKSSLNLGGANLDNFFGAGTKEQGDDQGSRVSESNIVPASHSTEYEKGNSMSAWEADVGRFGNTQGVGPNSYSDISNA